MNLADKKMVIGKLKEFLADKFDDYENSHTLNDDQSLISSGLLDSVAVLELVGFIENEFDITLDAADVDLENFDSLLSIANLLEKNYGFPSN